MPTMDDVNNLTNEGLENGKVDLSKWPDGKATRVMKAMIALGDAICEEQSCRPNDVVKLPLGTQLGPKAQAAFDELQGAFKS